MVLQWAGLYAGEEWPKLPRLTRKKTHETDREYKGNVTIRILNDSAKGLVVTFTLKCPRVPNYAPTTHYAPNHATEENAPI